nr:unnamed protein product [Callosobruchus analis]
MEEGWRPYPGGFLLGDSIYPLKSWLIPPIVEDKKDIEFEEKFNEDCILTLKAISEGARKVLLVGAKEAPVCFRDAITGLHLRTLAQSSLTCSVFSIIVDVDIYCATNSHVQVFSKGL